MGDSMTSIACKVLFVVWSTDSYLFSCADSNSRAGSQRSNGIASQVFARHVARFTSAQKSIGQPWTTPNGARGLPIRELSRSRTISDSQRSLPTDD
jgi:hypothetical protein